MQSVEVISVKTTYKLLLASIVLITALGLASSPAAACGSDLPGFEDSHCSLTAPGPAIAASTGANADAGPITSSPITASAPITNNAPITASPLSVADAPIVQSYSVDTSGCGTYDPVEKRCRA